MDLRTTKDFDKKLKNLSRDKKFLVLDILDLFQENPLDPSLRNHPLRGSMSGKRSISVSDDMRIIFVET
jgi:addiction module RelE/StbE family toxin